MQESERNLDPIVYVVDDDPAVCRAVAELVQTFGYQVRSYGTARDFLGSVNMDRPGCVVLDLRMPEMGGLELHQKMVDQGMNLPVVILTGYADTPSTVRLLQRGAVSVIDKPYREDELWRAIQDGVEKSRSELRRARFQSSVESRLRQLSPQDREVLNLMLSGTKNRSIASKLNVSLRTVENRRRRVFDIMQADSVARLTRIIVEYEYGVIPAPAPSEAWLSLPYERIAV